MENVRLKPHIGAGERRRAVRHFCAANIAAVFQGERPITPVNNARSNFVEPTIAIDETVRARGDSLCHYQSLTLAYPFAPGLLYTPPHLSTRARNYFLNIKALPYVTLLGFMFGSSMVFSRFGVGQFEPTTYIGIRMIISSLMALSVYRIATGRRLPRDRELWKRAGLLGVFGTAVPMTCVIISLQYLSSGVSALLLSTGPAITIILAHFALPDEHLSRRKVFGVGLALGGAMLLALSGEDGLPDEQSTASAGFLLVSVGMIFSSVMIIYARKRLTGYDAYDVGSIRIFSTALTVMPLSLLTVGFDLSAVTGAGYLALIYSAIVGTFLGLLLSFYNIKRFGATPSVMSTYIIPIVAGIGGVLVLGEEITLTMIFGMGVIVSGIALLQEYSSPATWMRRYPHRGSY